MHCRLCLYQAQILIPIRDKCGFVSKDILDTVDKYIGVLLHTEDSICVSCWSKVDDFRKFCTMVKERRAEYVWREEVVEQKEPMEYIKEEQVFIRETVQNTWNTLNIETCGAESAEASAPTNNSIERQMCTQKSGKSRKGRMTETEIDCKNTRSSMGIEKDVIVMEEEAQQQTCNELMEKNVPLVMRLDEDEQDENVQGFHQLQQQERNVEESLYVDKSEQLDVIPVQLGVYHGTNLNANYVSDEDEDDVIVPTTVGTANRSDDADLYKVKDLKISSTSQNFGECLMMSQRQEQKGDMIEPKLQITLSARKIGRPRDSDATDRASEDFLIARHMQLLCDVCEFNADCFERLKKHFKEQHNTSGYVVCCQKRLYKRSSLLDHINVHRDPAYFSCSSCAKNFADRLCLRNHMLLKHQQITESSYECRVCGAHFATLTYLQRHARKHAAVTKRLEEVKKREEKETKLKCTLCIKGYPTAARLQAHMKNVHNKRLHMQQRHEVSQEANVWQCQFCDTECVTRVALNAHRRLCHPGEGPLHTCNVCRRNFNTTRRLREHMSTHTGEYLYRCDYCDKRFKCSSNLYSHRKWKHQEKWARDQKHNGLNEKRHQELI